MVVLSIVIKWRNLASYTSKYFSCVTMCNINVFMIRRPLCTIHGWCISHFCPISGNMLLQPWQHDPSLLLSQHQFLLRQPRVFHWIELIKLLNWKQEVGIGNNVRLVNVRSFTHWKALDKHVSPCGNSLLKDTLFRNLALPIGKPRRLSPRL